MEGQGLLKGDARMETKADRFVRQMRSQPVDAVPDELYALIDEDATLAVRDRWHPVLLVFRDGSRANLMDPTDGPAYWVRSYADAPITGRRPIHESPSPSPGRRILTPDDDG